jgi:hypothetical protein
VKTFYGILLVGVCAAALGGCSTSGGGGTAAIANALLAGGTYAANGDLTPSDASADTKTTATITDNGGGSYTVAVTNGGAVAGPRDYQMEAPVPNSAFAYGHATQGNGSILVAGTFDSGNAFAGFVGATTDQTTGIGPGNIAAGFGGIAPTTLPTGTVTYGGPNHDTSAAGVIQTAGANPTTASGGAWIEANFANGTVNGHVFLDGGNPVTGPAVECCNIAFGGNMSTDHATYSSNSVAFNGSVATGNVIGGFYGTNGETTAGAFDVQDTGVGGSGAKATGSFLASSLPQ